MMVLLIVMVENIIESDAEIDKFKEHYANGIEQFMGRKFHKALNSFTKAIKLNPNSSEAYNERGVTKFNIGKIVSANTDFKNAITNAENNYFAYLNRSRYLVMCGEYDDALGELSMANNIKPDNLHILVNLGLVEKYLHSYVDSNSDFYRASNIEPKNFQELLLQAFALMQIKHFGDSINSVNKAESKNVSLISSIIKGDCYRLWGKNEDAELAYNESIKIFNRMISKTTPEYLTILRAKQGLEQLFVSYKVNISNKGVFGVDSLKDRQIRNFLRLYK